MEELHVRGWSLVAAGAVLVAFGAAATTMGWENLKDRHSNESLRHVILGSIVVGIGGTALTMGWGYLGDYSRMKGLIRAVAQEWQANDALFENYPLFDPKNTEALMSWKLYPEVHKWATVELLSSGYFSTKRADEKAFLERTWDQLLAIDDFNARFDVTDRYSLETTDRSDVRQRRLHLINSKGFQDLLAYHKAVGAMLQSRYPWSFKEPPLFSSYRPDS